MRVSKALIAVTLVVLALTGHQSQDVNAAGRGSVSAEILVKFRPGSSAGAKADAHRQAGGTRVAEIARTGVQLVRVRAGDESAATARYKRNPHVLYAEPNFIRSIPAPVSNPEGSEVVPADYYFDEQWALHNTGQQFMCIPWIMGELCFYVGTADADIDAPEAWAISKGSADIKVAVIDSGIDHNHPDLTANYAGGYDFIANDGEPDDEHGHGTHVAGTIAGALDNPTGDPARSEGVVGVAPNTRILAYKVCRSDGSCDDFAIQQAIARAISDGAKVINMSLGSPDISQSLYEAVQDAWNAGLVIIAGAGNEGSSNLFYPAAFDNVVAVGAFDEDHRRATFSNYGSWVDISAPGNVILSTYPMVGCAGSVPVPGDTGCYNWMSGTSMATPHVSGAAALVWSRSDVTTNSEVVDILLGSADGQGAANVRLDSWTIHGGLNVHDALSYGSLNHPPVADAGGPYAGTAGQTVSFDGRGSTDPDNDALVYGWDFGDGSTGTGATPAHTYNQVGEYTVVLTVDDQRGGTNSVSTTVVIAPPPNQPPVANAGFDQNLIDIDRDGVVNVALDGTGSSDSDGDIVSYEWREGGVALVSGPTPTVSLSVGTHLLTLVVTDNNGATATDSVVVTIQPGSVPADAVAIVKATYASRQRRLTVEATSSGAPTVTLTLFDNTNSAAPGQVGVLLYNPNKLRYSGTFSWGSIPTSVLVRSSGGGSVTGGVSVK